MCHKSGDRQQAGRRDRPDQDIRPLPAAPAPRPRRAWSGRARLPVPRDRRAAGRPARRHHPLVSAGARPGLPRRRARPGACPGPPGARRHRDADLVRSVAAHAGARLGDAPGRRRGGPALRRGPLRRGAVEHEPALGQRPARGAGAGAPAAQAGRPVPGQLRRRRHPARAAPVAGRGGGGSRGRRQPAGVALRRRARRRQPLAARRLHPAGRRQRDADRFLRRSAAPDGRPEGHGREQRRRRTPAPAAEAPDPDDRRGAICRSVRRRERPRAGDLRADHPDRLGPGPVAAAADGTGQRRGVAGRRVQ